MCVCVVFVWKCVKVGKREREKGRRNRRPGRAKRREVEKAQNKLKWREAVKEEMESVVRRPGERKGRTQTVTG